MPPAQQFEEALFRAAAELPSGTARQVFLEQACAGDSALRQRLAARLAARDKPVESIPAAVATIKLNPAEGEDEAVGKTIGRYKVLEKLGEGGCGVVYVAEQTEPVRRRVALKVIKLGMDTKEVIARFEAERQALAMMDHPNIAKVLDAGATEAGRPYFVMELVRGVRITEYCDRASLTTPERLALFIKVCQAIQHAHQKGIIHRDIKPSNILVAVDESAPVPKVIDFGIAKATEGRLTEATVYTQLNQFIGTPAYMSPEQAEMSGLDIDTRSDIYSLGVLLYELLAGRTPFDAQELVDSGLDAMRKTIREKEPIRPSTRLATLAVNELTTTAKRRSTEAPKLIRLLKGDLDWIVMKCLEKDRTRRYETANGVAADVKTASQQRGGDGRSA
jgi:serine/threonine protein kinase